MSKTRTVTREMGKVRGLATLVPSSFNAEDNTIDVVFATEIEVLRRDWVSGDLYREVIVCQSENVRLDRLNQGGPVLDSHDTYSVTNQFGVVLRAWVDDATREGKATLKLSDREDWKGVVSDIKSGIIRNISVGYNIYVFSVDDSDQTKPPIYRAIDWEPTEISFVTVPADFNSGSRANDDTQKHSVTINFTMRRTNAEIAEIFAACRAAGLTNEQADAYVNGELSHADALTDINGKRAAQPVDAAEVRKLEKTRAAGIRTAVRIAGLDEAYALELIDNDTPLAEARGLIIDKAAEKNPVSPRVAAPTVGADAADKKVRGMEASIFERTGSKAADSNVTAGEYRGATLMDLAKYCLADAGISTRGMSQREIAVRAMSMTRDGGGGLATGDFSYLLQNVLNKELRAAWQLQERTFTPFTRKSTASDFKPMLRAQLNDLTISAVAEGDEYTQATSGDTGESYKLAKYGKIVNINWEAIVNDDLNAFSRYPSLLAGAVAQMQGNVVYGILSANANMADGTALFASGHGNLAGAGTDITFAALSAGRQAMRQQKSPAGNPLNLTPKFIVVGPTKEAVALQMTSQNYVATKQSDINVWRGLMQPIVDARITDTSWYLFADPSLIDTIEYATLDGQDIYTESRYSFKVDSLQWKVRSAFAAKAIEWRSQYRNPGA